MRPGSRRRLSGSRRCIPALTEADTSRPRRHLPGQRRGWCSESRSGDARACPLRLLDWREILNDVVGGLPVTLASPAVRLRNLYDVPRARSRRTVRVRLLGLIARSDKLMHEERRTACRTSHRSPVRRPADRLPIELRSCRSRYDLAGVQAQHPDTRVPLARSGHKRTASRASPMGYPAASSDVPDARNRQAPRPQGVYLRCASTATSSVVRLQTSPAAGLSMTTVGDLPVVLIGDAATRTVRAYAVRRPERSRPGSDKAALVR